MIDVNKLGSLLLNRERPLKERFRALFSLRALKGSEPLIYLSQAFKDPSALLKHEVAYVLGQMKDPKAISILSSVLRDETQEPIVRHEAGEALSAIGDFSGVFDLLVEYSKDSNKEVSDTCRLGVEKLKWMRESKSDEKSEKSFSNPYDSIDPAPPLDSSNLSFLSSVLSNVNCSLFERYRAMFALRNLGTEDAILSLCSGLSDSNVLFRHEIAYVLGQIQSPLSKEPLLKTLENPLEDPMVRHECAEALGSLSLPDISSKLTPYLDDSVSPVLRESVIIALDFAEYNQSDEFQYAITA